MFMVLANWKKLSGAARAPGWAGADERASL
jgi:hypothetical protein